MKMNRNNIISGSFSTKIMDYLIQKDLEIGVSGECISFCSRNGIGSDLVVKGPLFMNHGYTDIEYMTNKKPTEFDLFIDGDLIVRDDIHFA